MYRNSDKGMANNSLRDLLIQVERKKKNINSRSTIRVTFLPSADKQQKQVPYLFSSPPHRREKSVCFPFHPFRHRTATTCTNNEGKEQKTRKRPCTPRPFVASLFTGSETPSQGPFNCATGNLKIILH